MSDFPAPQEKPARRLNYAEKVKAGLVERKPRQRIKPVSSKRQGENAEYARVKKEYLAEHLFCEILGCFETHLDIHHKARRGKFLLRVDTFLACCRRHHQQIESNPSWAKENGYILTTEQKRAIA